MSLLNDYAALTEACGLPRHDCQIVPYHPALLQMMDLREPDRMFFDHIPQFSQVIAAYNEMGPAYVGCHRGKPIIIFGCIKLWPGVCELWMLTDRASVLDVRATSNRHTYGRAQYCARSVHRMCPQSTSHSFH